LFDWSIRPTIVERAPDFDQAGYMLGLWPIGLFDRFRSISLDIELRCWCPHLPFLGARRFGPNLGEEVIERHAAHRSLLTGVCLPDSVGGPPRVEPSTLGQHWLWR
jgi:hypothetical protein